MLAIANVTSLRKSDTIISLACLFMFVSDRIPKPLKRLRIKIVDEMRIININGVVC